MQGSEVAFDLETVERLLAGGSGERGVAEFYGCSPQAVARRRQTDPEFALACKRGKARFNGSKNQGLARLSARPPEGDTPGLSPAEQAAERRARRDAEARGRLESDIQALRETLRSAAGAGPEFSGLRRQDLRDITGLDYWRINVALENMTFEVEEESRGQIVYYRLRGR